MNVSIRVSELQRQAHEEHKARQSRNLAGKDKVFPLALKIEYEAEIAGLEAQIDSMVGQLRTANEQCNTKAATIEGLSLALADAHARLISQAEAIATNERKQQVKSIVAEVLQNYPGVTWEDITSVRRTRELIQPRHECMHAVYTQRPDLSFPSIGRIFRRDHTSLIYAVRKIQREKAIMEGLKT